MHGMLIFSTKRKPNSIHSINSHKKCFSHRTCMLSRHWKTEKPIHIEIPQNTIYWLYVELSCFCLQHSINHSSNSFHFTRYIQSPDEHCREAIDEQCTFIRSIYKTAPYDATLHIPSEMHKLTPYFLPITTSYTQQNHKSYISNHFKLKNDFNFVFSFETFWGDWLNLRNKLISSERLMHKLCMDFRWNIEINCLWKVYFDCSHRFVYVTRNPVGRLTVRGRYTYHV